MNENIFTTKAEAIEQAIAPAFNGSEFGGNEYDLDAIADHLLEAVIVDDGDEPIMGIRKGFVGFRIRDGIDFWEVAERLELRVHTVTIPETGESFPITDESGDEVDSVSVAESEEWEPEAYAAALEAAGWRLIDDWEADGFEYAAHVVRI